MDDIAKLGKEELGIEQLREDIRIKRAHTALLKAQERREVAETARLEKDGK